MRKQSFFLSTMPVDNVVNFCRKTGLDRYRKGIFLDSNQVDYKITYPFKSIGYEFSSTFS